MVLTVKQLKQNNQIIVPQTIAEAVLVKQNNAVITLDTALKNKQNTIITPNDSGLIQYEQNNSVILTHSNNITANDKPKAILVQHDNHGHIIATEPMKKLTVSVEDKPIIEHDGSADNNLNFGDDFETDITNTIKLKFNNL